MQIMSDNKKMAVAALLFIIACSVDSILLGIGW